MNTHEALKRMIVELVRRGLPAEYAERTACEFLDHHRDLCEELRAAGRSEPDVHAEASRRLGDSRALIKKTVRAYRRRTWLARWPLITFFFAPIPVLFATWLALANLLWLFVVIATKLGLTSTTDAQAVFTGMPVAIKACCLAAAFLVVPAAAMYILGSLAHRAGVGRRWILIAGCLLGVFAGTFRWERSELVFPVPLPKLTDTRTGQLLEQPQRKAFFISMSSPFVTRPARWVGVERTLSSLAQSCQLLMPIAVAGFFVYLRQQALKAELRRLGRC